MQGARGFGSNNENNTPLQGVIENLETPESSTDICLQFADRYIVTTSREGVLIIDQRRAHIKILFEEFMANFKGQHSSQGLMFPDSIQIDPGRQDALQEIMPELTKAGFRLEYDSDF